MNQRQPNMNERQARQAREEAERQARQARQARGEAERQARGEAERQAREEAERQARQARGEAERQARQAREEAERQARQARGEAERQAREEAERPARGEGVVNKTIILNNFYNSTDNRGFQRRYWENIIINANNERFNDGGRNSDLAIEQLGRIYNFIDDLNYIFNFNVPFDYEKEKITPYDNVDAMSKKAGDLRKVLLKMLQKVNIDKLIKLNEEEKTIIFNRINCGQYSIEAFNFIFNHISAMVNGSNSFLENYKNNRFVGGNKRTRIKRKHNGKTNNKQRKTNNKHKKNTYTKKNKNHIRTQQ